MNFLKSFSRTVDAINERVGSAVSWLTTVLVIVVCYDVFTRYLMRNSSVAVQEMEWHLFALIFLLGAAYTLKHDRHVRVDIIYARLSSKGKAWIDLLGSLLFLLPFCIVAIWASQSFVANAFRVMETSPNPGGLPGRFLLKAAIPAGFVLLLLQGLSLAATSLVQILGRPEGEEVPDD